jgi:putative transposase
VAKIRVPLNGCVVNARIMARLSPKALCLTTSEQAELQQLLNRHSTPEQIALRTRIILLAKTGHNHRESARELKIGRKMARP